MNLKNLTTALAVASISPLGAEPLDVEKDELKFGFIKLTDCAPIVIAKEKGFFEEDNRPHPLLQRFPQTRSPETQGMARNSSSFTVNVAVVW